NDLLIAGPGFIEQSEWHPRGLARARRRHQHGGALARARPCQLAQLRIDWQEGIETERHGPTISSSPALNVRAQALRHVARDSRAANAIIGKAEGVHLLGAINVA